MFKKSLFICLMLSVFYLSGCDDLLENDSDRHICEHFKRYDSSKVLALGESVEKAVDFSDRHKTQQIKLNPEGEGSVGYMKVTISRPGDFIIATQDRDVIVSLTEQVGRFKERDPNDKCRGIFHHEFEFSTVGSYVFKLNVAKKKDASFAILLEDDDDHRD